jgi:hypothetical protein
MDRVWRIDCGAAEFEVSRHRASWFAVRMVAGTGAHRGAPTAEAQARYVPFMLRSSRSWTDEHVCDHLRAGLIGLE